jgi:hypothetical protein
MKSTLEGILTIGGTALGLMSVVVIGYAAVMSPAVAVSVALPIVGGLIVLAVLGGY